MLNFAASCKDDSPALFILKKDSGVHFNNQLSPDPDLNILTYLYYYNGGGVASADFNNDGLIDLYFTGNQVADRLYLNSGDLKFQDVTDASGIQNETGWTTGVSVVDINNDGLLDIYVCKVGEFKTISGQNMLFVNQGIDEKGMPGFKEQAGVYGLDIKSFATQASFFDYDLDGDLDMYLLNHSVNPNRTYGKGASRKSIDSLAGDKLFQNQDGMFVEVSEKSGIFQGKIGYGLGLGVSDLNHDTYPDLYIGNDFFENDYLYINQKDGTFKEIISANETNVGHTSHFSMGNDIADLDNDGWTDIVSLDMLPENLQAYKTSGREYNNSVYDQYLKNGYRPQYMQNILLHNKHGAFFEETAFASGIAATDWSWSPLIVDLDNDGHKDLFVSNGILGATNDMDFINFIANTKIQEQLNKGMEEKDLKFTEQLPQRKLSNYFFKNNGDLTFTDYTSNWFQTLPSFSNGSIYADLDNDGDQDLVVNNVNSEVFILENKTETSVNQFIKIKFNGPEKNTMGIGSKIKVFSDSLSIFQENYTTRGYLSAVAPEMTIGIGSREKIDSLIVFWPDGQSQKLININAGSTLLLDYKMASLKTSDKGFSSDIILSPSPISLDYMHSELPSYEFGREPLIPYSKGAEGPKISIADINKDGLEDLYIGGGKKQAGALYLQNQDASFTISHQPVFEQHKNKEETDNAFFDADNDGDLDMIVVSGGNEYQLGQELRPILYINIEGVFEISSTFPVIEVNASIVKTADMDADGDLDLIIGSNAMPRKFGRSAKNYVLFNDGKGNFKDVSELKAGSFSEAGLIEDLEIVDLNNDKLPDIIAVGHWMPISVFMNSSQGLHLTSNNDLDKTNGLWNHIRVADFDQDGDQDFIVGNWGLNTRLKASTDAPMQLYIADFDQNGKEETILTYFEQGQETVFSSKDDLSKQIPSINKKFLSYTDFAKAEFKNIFDKKILKDATLKSVYELSSCYFENMGNGMFQKHLLPFNSQLSSIKTIYLDDFNHDGFMDVLAAGNDYGISTQLSRLDASHGIVLLNDQKGFFTSPADIELDIPGKARDIAQIVIKEEKYVIITLNDAVPLFLKLKKTND
ncbi:VCBS repeat-containing protein [Lutimonas halocynthiae]|uniref:VCBS repeat-containing protein n=1 Tax=Lutimonas halocynthiae TaxID=1446477 RepID=UPI0025B526B9|nr:VCBS repeat-containing protein [Lutimonas halocynthiae]MDN3643544.1 VCBS repeat-containing protein [Lutimonas halocynthiae]